MDAQTGEPIAKATVSIPASKIEAATDGAGVFVLPGVPRGDVEIVVTTIGYGIARKTVHVAEGMSEVEIRVGQEAFKRTEEVVVEAPPFDPVDAAAPAAHSLRGIELRNLGGVLTDDPLRSVQSLPGIATGDDFYASFATRGSGFSTVGFYLDGVLMSAPFHTIRDVNDGYSLTILNGDVVESLSLISGGAPARYGDRTGAVLDVQTREGNRDEFSGRASLGASGVYGTLEGPIGACEEVVLARLRAQELPRLRARPLEHGFGHHDRVLRRHHAPGPSPDARPDPRPDATSTAGPSGRTRTKASPRRRARRPDPISASCNGGATRPPGAPRLEAFATRETGRNLDENGGETFVSESSQAGLRTDVARGLGAHRLEGGLALPLAGRARHRPRFQRTHVPGHRGLRREERAMGRLPAGHRAPRGAVSA